MNNLRILSLSAVLLASTLSADCKSAWRYDAGARIAVAAISGSYKYVPTNDTTDTLLTEKVSANGTSFQGGVFGEAAYLGEKWFGGVLVDVFGDTLNNKPMTYSLGSTIQYQAIAKAPIHGGADVRFGRFFGKSLWYVLGGVEGARFKVSLINTTGADRRGIPANSDTVYSYGRAGGRVGTGVEFEVSETLRMKLEYRAVFFGNHNIVSLTDTTVMPNVNYDRFLQATQHSTALQLSYVF